MHKVVDAFRRRAVPLRQPHRLHEPPGETPQGLPPGARRNAKPSRGCTGWCLRSINPASQPIYGNRLSPHWKARFQSRSLKCGSNRSGSSRSPRRTWSFPFKATLRAIGSRTGSRPRSRKCSGKSSAPRSTCVSSSPMRTSARPRPPRPPRPLRNRPRTAPTKIRVPTISTRATRSKSSWSAATTRSRTPRRKRSPARRRARTIRSSCGAESVWARRI